jgi:hypothetical protein
MAWLLRPVAQRPQLPLNAAKVAQSPANYASSALCECSRTLIPRTR